MSNQKKIVIIVPENRDFIRISVSSNVYSLINGNSKFNTIGIKQEYEKYGGLDLEKSFTYICPDASLLKKQIKTLIKSLKINPEGNVSGKSDIFAYLGYEMILKKLEATKITTFNQMFNVTFDKELTLKIAPVNIESQAFLEEEKEVSKVSIKPTSEQLDILEGIKKEKNIKINAFAGTGKTSTLQMISKELEDKKILYLAFNNSVAKEGKGKFSRNVDVLTTHSLAYRTVQKETSLDLSELKQSYRAKELEDILNISYNDAFLVLKIINKYMHSDKTLDSYLKEEEINNQLLENKAKEFWELMDSGEINLTHDFYLKKFEINLKGEKFFSLNDYDVVMLDEAQDTNVVTMSIFDNLPAKLKIIVGDKHQQIYSFRNSINAMNVFVGKEFPLTETFRYTEDIASLANVVLKDWKNENLFIKSQVKDQKKANLKQAYLYRTNSKQIEKIKEFIEEGVFFKTVREPTRIFSLMLELMYSLSSKKEEIKENHFLKSFDSILELKEYADSTEDIELKSSIKVIERNNLSIKDVEKMIEISTRYYKSQSEAKITLSSIHTAKGLEWDEVFIGSDLISIEEELENYNIKGKSEWFEALENDTARVQPLIDEINIKYIAITRAKTKVIYSS